MPDARSLALAAAGSLLAAAGAVVWLTNGDAVSMTADPAARATTPPPIGTTALPVRAEPEPGSPRRVLIPALDVSAPVVPVKAPDRTLVPPADPSRLGWWADGAKPGAGEGSALIAGHTVHTGGGALDDLEELDAGDEVVVRTDQGRVRYVVDRVRIYSKGRIADDATQLFSQDSPGRLVLITCEDWDGSRYLSNVVVTATPA
ncbi:class F sortase [Nocardioides caricicola]|uniref:Class F sortase n=1 Tax=Nocardioides caricicola TaxID=634770 RepID=A0ABW0N0D6_9ACTN